MKRKEERSSKLDRHLSPQGHARKRRDDTARLKDVIPKQWLDKIPKTKNVKRSAEHAACDAVQGTAVPGDLWAVDA
ncbi:MAG: hypothetical protein GOMPHAMPRED_006056 [Gomphillus americanus]|uniref:Uncharacterized protein n=1 Tax=Gomphillus americanus TaxID=1940652 RepID=A0A8H3I7P4_9LECA|nr:MAG: hypothetical protein GOMPHAMPRED_006056 [Gomphillus americanus]